MNKRLIIDFELEDFKDNRGIYRIIDKNLEKEIWEMCKKWFKGKFDIEIRRL